MSNKTKKQQQLQPQQQQSQQLQKPESSVDSLDLRPTPISERSQVRNIG